MNGTFGEFSFDFGVGYVNSDLGGIATVDPRLLARNLFLGNNNWVPGCDPGQTPVVTGGVPNCFDYGNSYASKSLSGASNLYSPKLSYTLSFNYGFQLGNGKTLRPRGRLAHVDDSFASLFQSDNFFRIDPRDLVNVSVTYEATRGSCRPTATTARTSTTSPPWKAARATGSSTAIRSPSACVSTSGSRFPRGSPGPAGVAPHQRGEERRRRTAALDGGGPQSGSLARGLTEALSSLAFAGGSTMAESGLFGIDETHGRVLRTGNEVLSQSTDIGWCSLVCRQVPGSASVRVGAGRRSSVADLPPRKADGGQSQTRRGTSGTYADRAR